ncbi:hypothetical protein [Mesomycoplasma conjunctivae]|uniref:hypothetical protein n=1 Tax=Mesomycoplasma conjunctivae TaxID=45361 RepID=UPI003DA25170
MEFFKNERVIESIIKKHFSTHKTNTKYQNHYNEEINWQVKKWTLHDSKKAIKFGNRWYFSYENKLLFSKSFSHIVPIICDTEKDKENLIMDMYLYTYSQNLYQYNQNWKYTITDEQIFNYKRVEFFNEDGKKTKDLWVNFDNKHLDHKTLFLEWEKRNYKHQNFFDITEIIFVANYSDLLLNKLKEKNIEIDLIGSSRTSINLYVANLYALEKSIKNYIMTVEDKAKAFEDLKNMTHKADKLAKSTTFSQFFKKFEIDPGSDFEVVTKLSNEFEGLKHFLIPDYNKNLTLRFRKIDNHKSKGIYFPHAENLTININNHKEHESPHITSFFHEYAHHIDSMLGYKVDSPSANLINLRIPFSLSNPDFAKLHKKYIEVFETQENLEKIKNFKKAKIKNYLTSESEVFARGFERYLAELDFQSSFNRTQDQLDLSGQDVFDYLDKDTKDAFYKMYEDIFEIKKKMELVEKSSLEMKTKENEVDQKLEDELIKKELLPELIKIEKNENLVHEIKDTLAAKMVENYKQKYFDVLNDLSPSNLSNDLTQYYENLLKKSILENSNLIDFRNKFIDQEIEGEFWEIVGTKYKEYNNKLEQLNQQKANKKIGQVSLFEYELEQNNSKVAKMKLK